MFDLSAVRSIAGESAYTRVNQNRPVVNLGSGVQSGTLQGIETAIETSLRRNPLAGTLDGVMDAQRASLQHQPVNGTVDALTQALKLGAKLNIAA